MDASEPDEQSPLLSAVQVHRTVSTMTSNGHAVVSASRVSRHVSVEDISSRDRITLSWRGVNVFGRPPGRKLFSWKKGPNEEPTQILKNVSGIALPGSLLAIMGASGAGKTTLLNVLNQRGISRLKVEGNLCVNGFKVGNASAVATISGYVRQDDLFVGTLTVAEHLWFQSMLRMDRHLSSEARKRRVSEVMSELGLTKCADVLIGTPPRVTGISGGEKKRLSFACEVLTDPPLLFCDEPTSGLDSFMAENVVSCLKRLASKGKTVIATIHQPSSQVYAMFDRVLFMAEGRVAYLGPAAEIAEFFAKLGQSCPPNYNPADCYIHQLAIVPGREEECRESVRQVCDGYEVSPQFVQLSAELDKIENLSHVEDVLIGDITRRSPYKASYCTQFMVVLWRSWQTLRRDPVLLRARVTQTLIVAILYGLVYLQQSYDQKGVMNINGAMFLMQTQMTFGTLFAVLNTFPLEFPIYLREHHNGMYRTSVYFMSKFLAEMPLFLLLPIVFGAISYWMIGLYSNLETFLIALAVLILVANVSVSFGYTISCSTSNVTMALTIAPIILIPFMLFGGFFLNSGSVPVYLIWLKYISWFSYSNEIMVVNQWKRVTNITCESPHQADAQPNSTFSLASVMSLYNQSTATPCPPAMGSRCFPNGEAVISSLSFSEDNMIMDFSVLIGLLVGFRFISFIVLLIRSRKSD